MPLQRDSSVVRSRPRVDILARARKKVHYTWSSRVLTAGAAAAVAGLLLNPLKRVGWRRLSVALLGIFRRQGISPPPRSIALKGWPTIHPYEIPIRRAPDVAGGLARWRDRLLATPQTATATSTSTMPSTAQSFDGVKKSDNQSNLGYDLLPPDTNGDVGPITTSSRSTCSSRSSARAETHRMVRLPATRSGAGSAASASRRTGATSSCSTTRWRIAGYSANLHSTLAALRPWLPSTSAWPSRRAQTRSARTTVTPLKWHQQRPVRDARGLSAVSRLFYSTFRSENCSLISPR